jgi:hypothetical protein
MAGFDRLRVFEKLILEHQVKHVSRLCYAGYEVRNMTAENTAVVVLKPKSTWSLTSIILYAV